MRILTDPALRSRILHIRRRAQPPPPEALRALDAVLISHAHHDHLDPPSLRLLEGNCPAVVPRGCRALLRRGGFKDVVEVDVGDRVRVGKMGIEALPAAHDGRRYPFGRRRPALGFLLEGPPRIYFAGDTDLYEAMDDLAGRVDVAVLPVAGWGSRVPDGHLDAERAARAAVRIRPRTAIPIHWGALAAGSKAAAVGSRAPQAFVREAARVAPGVEVQVLAPGERLEL